MKKILRLTALVLIAVLTLACFSGCGAANDAPENPIVSLSLLYGENSESAAADSNQGGSQQPQATVAPTASSDNAAPTDANTPANDKPADSDKPNSDKPANPDTPANSSGAPSTPAEVVNYYKECYDKIAKEGKSATLTWNNTTNSPAVLQVGALSSVASSLMGSFLKEATPNTELAVADVAPKGVTTCNLTADMVADATCTDKGSTYEVHIKLKPTQDNPDVNPPAGGGKAGTIVDVVDVADITNAAGSFVNFDNPQNSYFDTEVTATIDKATGHITELYTKCPSIMSFGKVAVKPMGFPSIENAQIGLTYENKYSIAY